MTRDASVAAKCHSRGGRAERRPRFSLATREPEVGSTSDRDAMLLAVARLETHTSAFAARRIQRHHVAHVNRCILLNASALRIALVGTHVFPHAVDAFNDHAIL